MENFLKNWFRKEAKKQYTEADLKTAEAEYVTAATEANAVDYEAEDFDQIDAAKKITRLNNATENYNKINRDLHPELYKGENTDNSITIVPEIPLSEETKHILPWAKKK